MSYLFNKLNMVIVQYFLSYIFTIIFNIYKPANVIYLSLGIFLFNFIGAFILENTNQKVQKISLITNHIINFIMSSIYFLYYKNIIILSEFQIKILWIVIGCTLTFGTNHFLKILNTYYKNNIKLIYNISNIFLWFIVGLFIYFKNFIIDNSNMFFLIYVFFIYKLIYLIYISDSDEEITSNNIKINNLNELKNYDKNFFISCLYFIIILHVQFYSLVGLSVNILYLLFGGILSSIIFNIVTINNQKFFMLITIIQGVVMFYVPHIYQSIISGMMASSIFFTYEYMYTYYSSNMCKIFSILNMFNFISKNFLILYYITLKNTLNFNILYSFLLIFLYTYIFFNFNIEKELKTNTIEDYNTSF